MHFLDLPLQLSTTDRPSAAATQGKTKNLRRIKNLKEL